MGYGGGMVGEVCPSLVLGQIQAGTRRRRGPALAARGGAGPARGGAAPLRPAP